jgi:hypothetical protein
MVEWTPGSLLLGVAWTYNASVCASERLNWILLYVIMILSAWDFWASVFNVEPLNALATFSVVAVINARSIASMTRLKPLS